MDDFLYNNLDMTGDQQAKIALIDSGNTSIQLPQTMFDNVMREISKVDRTVFTQQVDGNTIMVSRKQCKDLWNSYSDISFMLSGTEISIKPRGYLYSLPNQNDDCFIGLQAIPDSANQYRLGTIFLRNFYTGLDYDQNLIMIGANAYSSDAAKAQIRGKAKNPFAHDPSAGPWVAIILVVIVMFGLAIFFYLRAKKQNENNTFISAAKAPVLGGATKAVPQRTNINESLNESADLEDVHLDKN